MVVGAIAMVGLGGVRHAFFDDAVGGFTKSGQLLALNDAPGNDDTVSVKLVDLYLV